MRVVKKLTKHGKQSPDPGPPYDRHLCQNHPFIDGNRRVGANAAMTFLLMNNWEPCFDEEDSAWPELKRSIGVWRGSICLKKEVD